jgi:amino acid transporter
MGLSGMGLLFAYTAVAFAPALFPSANPIMFYLVGCILILPLGGVYVLMGSIIARDGGDYVWVSRVIHPGVGFATNFAITAITLSFIGTSASTATRWGLAEMFYDFGLLYRDPSFIGTGLRLLHDNVVTLVLAFVIISAAAAIVGVSSRLALHVVRWWSVIAIVIGALFAWAVISSGASGFMMNFNALSGSDYEAVIAAGQKLGAQPDMPPFLTIQALYAGAFSLFSFVGFNFPTYFGGEVRQVRKSHVIAIFGGIAVFAVFRSAITAVEYLGEGPAFANAIARLWISGSASFPYLTTPLASGMSVFWTRNPLLVAVFNLSYVGTIVVMDVAILFALSRNLFAWSFDRVVPVSFAQVNSRTGAPMRALIAMTLGAMLYAYLAVFRFGLLSALFSYDGLGAFSGFMIVSFTAIIYPFRAKFLHAASGSPMKIGAICLFLVLGILSLGSCSLTIYSIIRHAVGQPVASIIVSGVIPTFTLGAVLYLVSYLVRKRQGVDLGLLRKVLPPD